MGVLPNNKNSAKSLTKNNLRRNTRVGATQDGDERLLASSQSISSFNRLLCMMVFSIMAAFREALISSFQSFPSLISILGSRATMSMVMFVVAVVFLVMFSHFSLSFFSLKRRKRKYNGLVRHDGSDTACKIYLENSHPRDILLEERNVFGRKILPHLTRRIQNHLSFF